MSKLFTGYGTGYSIRPSRQVNNIHLFSMPATFSWQHLDKVDEMDTNDVEFEDEKESEDEEEIESASDGEDVGDDVSETCSEKDDEPLEFNENGKGVEPNSEKQQRLVIFFSSILFQLSPTTCSCCCLSAI